MHLYRNKTFSKVIRKKFPYCSLTRVAYSSDISDFQFTPVIPNLLDKTSCSPRRSAKQDSKPFIPQIKTLGTYQMKLESTKPNTKSLRTLLLTYDMIKNDLNVWNAIFGSKREVFWPTIFYWMEKNVGIVPSNYYCMFETMTFYIDISFYISLCMCHEMIVIILKYHSR